MFGKYSKIMNFSSLHHILLLESILWDKHKWMELFFGIHVCEIEGFHMVKDRPVHSHNTTVKVFCPRNVANVLDNFYEYHESTEVNTLIKYDPTLWHRDMSLKSKWLIGHFYQPRKIEFKVQSLQNLTQFQLMSNLMMKRLTEFCLRATNNI